MKKLCLNRSLSFWLVARAYGWREGARAIPRMAIGNMIAMLAAWRAIIGYLRQARGSAPAWDKTRHVFPTVLPAE